MKNNIVIMAFSLVILTGIFKSAVFVFSLFLYLFLFGVYHTKTNGLTTHRAVYKSLFKFKDRREHKSRVSVRKKLVYEKFLRPRYVFVFIPLIVFLLVVYLFLSHTIFFAVITSDSMSPTLKTGDLVLMHNTDFTVQEGDIIMFSVPTERNLIVHRVRNVTDEGILTMGDATNRTDSWVVDRKDVESKIVIFGGYPMVMKGTGTYFIENSPSNNQFSGELHFTSLILMTIKNIGLILFVVAITLYLTFTMKDVQKNRARRRYK